MNLTKLRYLACFQVYSSMLVESEKFSKSFFDKLQLTATRKKYVTLYFAQIFVVFGRLMRFSLCYQATNCSMIE